MSKDLDSESTRNGFLTLQERICGKLLELDPLCKETEEAWDREEGGGGITRAFAKGDAMEKGGINFSDVHGKELPPSATQNRPELSGLPFRAMGGFCRFPPLQPICAYQPCQHSLF